MPQEVPQTSCHSLRHPSYDGLVTLGKVTSATLETLSSRVVMQNHLSSQKSNGTRVKAEKMLTKKRIQAM